MRAINDEPDYTKAGNYWRWLKRKLNQDGIQLVSPTHDFKFEEPDGKQHKADVLRSEDVLFIANISLTAKQLNFLIGLHTATILLTVKSQKGLYII